MTPLLIATRNVHKTREIAAMLEGLFAVEDLAAHHGLPEVEETEETFAGNAALKAVAISRLLPDRLVMADDSGLEVDALGGEPGVRSARYSGEGATDARNLALLLERMTGREDRAARFRCAIALARGGVLVASFEGSCEGRLTEEPRGAEGFGYDPIFLPEGERLTFAELPAAAKNAMSHRARALGAALEWLRGEGARQMA